jgi:SAM-dependent methyltransferase
MRKDGEEACGVYDGKGGEFYLNSRSVGSFFNDCLTTPVLRKFLKEKIEGKSVLDVGCGFGRDLFWCLDNGAKEVVGIDLSRYFVNVACSKRKVGNFSILNLSAYDVCKLGKKFDLIYSNMAFDQIEDLGGVLKSLGNVLRDEGRVFFTASHPVASASRSFKEPLRYFSKGKYYFHPKSHSSEIPYYMRSFQDYFKIFSEAGFFVEDIYEPAPSGEFKEKYSKEWDFFSRAPLVVAFSLRRIVK